jgi:hypothetical protein
MQLEPWLPPCILFGWWFSPWVLLQVWLVCIVVLPMGLQTSQLLQSFSNSSIKVTMRNLMVGCKHPHLYWSGSGRSSQETDISSSCQQALLGMSNSVLVWWLHVGWMPRWDSFWTALLSVSAPIFVPVFLLYKSNSGLIFLR